MHCFLCETFLDFAENKSNVLPGCMAVTKLVRVK